MKNFVATLRKTHAALDLTVGNPLRRILIFMLPMLIGNIFQQTYALVDTAIVGRALGDKALTGVSCTGAINFLILGFMSGLTHGFSVVVSRHRGAKDDESVRRAFAHGIVLTLGIVAVMTAVALVSAKPLLEAMHTLPQFMPYAVEYISVIYGGMIFAALYNQFASTLRAIGDSVMPLVFLVISCLTNAGLDCLLIFVFDMGVGGAAAATVIANGLSALLTFIYLWIKYPELRLSRRHFKPDAKQYAEQLKTGVPMALQLSVISIGMIIGQVAMNTMPATAQTAYAAASKVDGFATSIMNSGGTAAATYVGQNYGAKRYDRIKIGVKRFVLFMWCVALGIAVILLLLYRPLVMIFIPESALTEELLGYAFIYLACNAGLYSLLGTLCIVRSALQGMGRSTLALTAAVAELVMRVTVALIAMRFGSFTIVCLLNGMSWVGANIMLIPSFLITLKKYVPLFGKSACEPPRLPNPSTIPGSDRRRS